MRVKTQSGDLNTNSRNKILEYKQEKAGLISSPAFYFQNKFLQILLFQKYYLLVSVSSVNQRIVKTPIVSSTRYWGINFFFTHLILAQLL